jgi:hypothetical protein
MAHSSSLPALARIAHRQNIQETHMLMKEIIHPTSNQTIKPTVPLRGNFGVLATDPRPWLISFSLGRLAV